MKKRYRRRLEHGLYRSRQGVIGGVCRGLADYFDFSVFWIRAIMIILLILTGLWPILGLYFLAFLIMKPNSVHPIETEAEQEFYDSYVSSRKNAVQRLKRRFNNLDRRIQRMEDAVTGREFEWEERFNGNYGRRHSS